MIPRAIIPEDDYLSAFRDYVFELARKWIGVRVESLNAEAVCERIQQMSVSNHRASYLLYLLPFAKTSFVDPPWQSPAQSMRRVLLSIRLNGLPYNDFMLNRFCDILLGQTDKKKLFAEPLPEDYKDLQKLVWTFIVTFRKAISVQYSQEADVI